MNLLRLPLAGVMLATFAAATPAQDFPPAPVQPPDAATLKEIAARNDKLGNAVSSLRRRGVNDGLVADAEVYHKAVTWLVKHEEFYHKDSGTWALDACDHGLLRAAQLSRGEAPWLQESGHGVVRAYRSRLDDSVQPYAVTLPADYGQDRLKRHRLDIVLHGRDNDLTEVKF